MKLLAGRGAECLHGPVIKTHPVGSEDETAGGDRARSSPIHRTSWCSRPASACAGWLEAADAIQLGDELRSPARRGRTARPRSEGHRRARHGGFERRLDRAPGPVRRHHRSPRDAGRAVARGSPCSSTAPAPRNCATQIEEMGADVVRVPVYRWSLPADTTDAERLIRAVVDRRVDALTFTAKPAVENFLEIAGFMGVLDDVIEALQSGDVVSFCVGPVCAVGDHRGRPARSVRPRAPSARAPWCSRWRSTSPARARTSRWPGRRCASRAGSRSSTARRGRLAHRPGTGAARRAARPAGRGAVETGAAPAGLARGGDRRTPRRGDRRPPPSAPRSGLRRDRDRRSPRLPRQRGVRRRRASARDPAFRFAERTAGRGRL